MDQFGDASAKPCERNFATVINLLRVLQKLVKNSPLRVAMLIQYKSPGVIKKVLKVD